MYKQTSIEYEEHGTGGVEFLDILPSLARNIYASPANIYNTIFLSWCSIFFPFTTPKNLTLNPGNRDKSSLRFA